MPHSVTLSNLSWSTPDGRPLFSDLNIVFGPERAGLVGRNGVGKTTLLNLIAGDLSPASGSVAAPAGIHILRQSVQVAEGDTVADLFGVRHALALIERAQAGTATLEELADIDWMLEPDIEAALARFGLSIPLSTSLAQLSGGQRTRAALAAQIYHAPDFLILDEPTNNLDRDGRAAVIELLAGWRQGAMVVSHDREILENVDAIIELTSLGISRYGGNWSHYRERKALELDTARHDLADAQKRLGEVERKAQETMERQARRDGAGKRKAAEGGMPRISAGGRAMRAEQTGGEKAAAAGRMAGEKRADVSAARDRLEVLDPFKVSLPSTGIVASRTVLRVDKVTAGYASDAPVLSDISLTMTGPERFAVIGSNGTGKTTLLSVITGGLAPFSGSVRVEVPCAFLDQKVSLLQPQLSIRDNFMRLNPGASENACRAALARFMFRGDAGLRQVRQLSGGQMLRAGLACVLGGERPPQLLILDEPTNHLDLDSIAAVEAGLVAYDGALLVVSHDEAFLKAIGITRRFLLGAPLGA
ncbi:ABC-F family ATP-binding cassette domain-containing protein [Aliirhizobium smilacinae]|uniref:ABC-F family ATP-binding cassette domain-containing protein n=1 Tax=Aliirhizobium smilacinae TaxID=1395944 RepID=A0A5C4XLE6_9HYPH|nr:ABC-F family ATP-binding cassette domain-containing protein [Rhizobium smilacinae]TNM63334.1 ABC-F family ATP-binding cassette domain-containing protein [Rhizobium smilacinae]